MARQFSSKDSHRKWLSPTKKINIFDLNIININFLQEITKFNNIEIVELPIFEYYYIDKGNKLITNTISVSTTQTYGLLNRIKGNQNDLFYIYMAQPNYSRLYQRKDILLLRNRKEKLEKLNNIISLN